MAEKSTSPWVWIGCGCVATIVAVIGVFVALGALGVREVRSLAEDMRDPTARRDRVADVIGTDEMPGGYHPMVAFSVPFLFDMAMLSSIPPDEDGDIDSLGDSGFLYLKLLSLGGGEEIDDFFAGRTDDPEVLERAGVNLNLDEVVNRGAAEHAQAEVDWVANRGGIVTSQGGGSTGNSLVAVIRFGCPDDNRRRIGLWFTPDPQAEDPEAPFDGSAADPVAIEALIAPLRPCG